MSKREPIDISNHAVEYLTRNLEQIGHAYDGNPSIYCPLAAKAIKAQYTRIQELEEEVAGPSGFVSNQFHDIAMGVAKQHAIDLEEFVINLAEQITTDEYDEDDEEAGGDFEGAWDSVIEDARRLKAKLEGLGKGQTDEQ